MIYFVFSSRKSALVKNLGMCLLSGGNTKNNFIYCYIIKLRLHISKYAFYYQKQVKSNKLTL